MKNFQILNIFPGTNLTDNCNVLGTLSWFVINISYVIGEKLAKPRQKFNYNDKGQPQFFYEIVQYWVTYDLVKIIAKYGLKPEFNDNLKSWSKDIYSVVYYLQTNNEKDNDGKRGKICLDMLYDTSNTVHWTNFGRCGLGSKRHLANMSNFALPLVLITWQRMLVEHFHENTKDTFFEKGNYEPQKKPNLNYPLNNIHLKVGGPKQADMDSQVNSFDDFTIKEKLSLGYWADKILQQEDYLGITSKPESQAKTTGDTCSYAIMNKKIRWEKDKDDDNDEAQEKVSNDVLEQEIVLDENKKNEQLKTIAEAMNVGRTLLAKINRKTKEQKKDESTVNLGCNLLQKFIARELNNDDIFANWDTFMEWIRDQKDIETVVVHDDDSENFDDNGRQRNIEGTLNKNNSDENSDGSDYTSSSDDEEETDNFLTDVNGNKIIDELNTNVEDGDKSADPSTEVSTRDTSNNGEKHVNKQTDGIDEQGGDEDMEKEQSTRKRKGKVQDKKENKKAK